MNSKDLENIVVSASLEAGAAIKSIYLQANFSIETKTDNSPLTAADKVSHQVILKYLNNTPYPIISEEGCDVDFEIRKNWDTYWLIDPLDGTKEFIKKNGEFTTNIALIREKKPILGAIYSPIRKELYVGGKLLSKAYVQNENKEISPLQNKPVYQKINKVVVSRSHLNEETQEFIKTIGNPQTKAIGSSLKFMLLARGEAEIYPRFGPTMEWDTAAADAIVSFLGFQLKHTDDKSKTLTYNKENLLNPHFICK